MNKKILGPRAMTAIATYRAYTEARDLVQTHEAEIIRVRQQQYSGYEEDVALLRNEIRIYRNMERQYEEKLKAGNITKDYVAFLQTLANK